MVLVELGEAVGKMPTLGVRVAWLGWVVVGEGSKIYQGWAVVDVQEVVELVDWGVGGEVVVVGEGRAVSALQWRWTRCCEFLVGFRCAIHPQCCEGGGQLAWMQEVVDSRLSDRGWGWMQVVVGVE